MKKEILALVLTALLLVGTGCSTTSEGVLQANEPNHGDSTQQEEQGEEGPTEGQNDEGSKQEDIQEEQPAPALKYPYAPEFNYPAEGVMGIYVTANTAGGSRFQELMQFLDDTELNAVVIDLKDDHGYIPFPVEGDGLVAENSMSILNPEQVITTLKEHEVYPIARIVAFKDTVLATKHPELSFQEGGQVWKNRRGEAFINPFLKETWEYNVEIAKRAAQIGFKEVQFDYVRFPEGFENRDQHLVYSMGEYTDKQPQKFIELEQAFMEAQQKYVKQLLTYEMKLMKWNLRMQNMTEPTAKEEAQQKVAELKAAIAELHQQQPQPPQFSEKERLVQLRVDAVTDFVSYARQELAPYGVHVSVDIFGYSATVSEAPGIGQNFTRISEQVDVISSMIYPSHWGTSYFGVNNPDLHPYELVTEYAKVENQVLAALGEKRPISRPWIQDFTASYLPKGTYQVYGKAQIEAQIRALHEQGIIEFLLWDPTNRFTRGVDYTPLTP